MTRKERKARSSAAAKAMWAKKRASALPPPSPAPASARHGRVADGAVEASRGRPAKAEKNIFTLPEFPKAAQPPKGKRLAQDSSVADVNAWAWGLLTGIAIEGQTFLGYPYLAELSQRPEYRRMVEQLAFHMTRRWIRLKHKSSPAGDPARTGIEDDGPLPGEKPPQAAKPGAQDAFPPKPANGNGKAAPGAAPFGEEEPELSAAGTPLVEPEFTQADAERDEKTARLAELEAELKRLGVKQHFKEIVEQDGFFGRGHLYLDFGTTNDANELAVPIGNGRDDLSALKVKKGSLLNLKPVEPMWVYPTNYNAIDPLAQGWYRPDYWYVMSRQVHRTRLLTFVSREVPDMLKPAYAFGGLPLTQIAKPYVDNWLRARQSVSDLLQSFTQFVLSTDMLAAISTPDGAAQLYKRLDVFNNTRSNRGVLAIDKEREALVNVSAPLGSLDKLQAQAQEQMCSVSGIPILFLLGDQPAGLNASSEGAIRAFYDWVGASQEFLFEAPLDSIIGFAMLNLWGEIDDDIEWEFVKLWTPTEKEESDRKKTEADRDAIYLGEGVVHADEVRDKLVNDPDSGYKLSAAREMPEPPPPELPPGLGAPGMNSDEPPGALPAPATKQ